MPEERQPEPPRRGPKEYPSNAHVDKEAARAESPKFKKVIQGEATRKVPLSRRIRESMTGDDASSIGSYLLFEVIIPAVKDLVVDTGKEALERAFFPQGGGPRSRSRGSGSSFSGGSFGSRQPYRSGARNHDVPFEREERRALSSRARNQYKFDEIILPTRGDAEVALEAMKEAVDMFGQVNVAEVLDMLGQGDDTNYVMQDWGWTDLNGASVRRLSSDEWLLDLPPSKRFQR